MRRRRSCLARMLQLVPGAGEQRVMITCRRLGLPSPLSPHAGNVTCAVNACAGSAALLCMSKASRGQQKERGKAMEEGWGETDGGRMLEGGRMGSLRRRASTRWQRMGAEAFSVTALLLEPLRGVAGALLRNGLDHLHLQALRTGWAGWQAGTWVRGCLPPCCRRRAPPPLPPLPPRPHTSGSLRVHDSHSQPVISVPLSSGSEPYLPG